MERRNIGIALSVGRVAVNAVCGLVLSSVLLRMLGDAQYGVYQTVAAFAHYLVLLEFGMGTVMVRNLSVDRAAEAEPGQLQHQVDSLWTMTVCLSTVILAAGAAFGAWIPRVYENSMTAAQCTQGQRIFWLLTGSVVLSFLAETAGGVLLACAHYRFAAMEGMTRTALRAMAILLAVQGWKNALVIAVADLVFSMLQLVVTAWYCRKATGLRLRIGRADRAILRAAAPLALAVFLQTAVNQVNSNVDRVLIGVLVGPEAVALYSVALFVYGAFAAVTTVPVSLYGPEIQQRIHSGGDLTAALAEPCRLTAILGGAVLAGFAAVGRPFIRLFYGADHLQAWGLALVLLVPAYLQAVTASAINGLDAKNKRLGRSIILAVTTVMNVVLTVLWLGPWGMTGAAVATALSTLLGQVVLGNLHYRRVLGISAGRLYRAAFRDGWLWLALGCGAGAAVSRWIDNDLAALVCGGAVCLLCMMPALWKIWKK